MEKPTEQYDVFISCKSEDYEDAAKIHEYLNRNGVKAFLASQDLRSIGESEYRDAITEVIRQAYHMIVFASRPEYVDTTWVKYEWDLFMIASLNHLKRGQLLTVLKGIRPKDINLALLRYQSFDFNSYEAELLDYVQTPQSRKRAEKEAAQRRQAEEMQRRRESLLKAGRTYHEHVAELQSVYVANVNMLAASLGIENRKCPVCGAEVPLADAFCGRCGAPVSPLIGITGAEALLAADEKQLRLLRDVYLHSVAADAEVAGLKESLREATAEGEHMRQALDRMKATVRDYAAVLRRCDELEDKLLQCQSRSEREINRLKQELQQCGPSGIDKHHKG